MSKRVASVLLIAAAVAGPGLVGLAQDPAADSKILVGHSDPVYSVDFTPDGAQIVTGSFDKTLKLWDAATKKPVRTFNGHTALVLTVAVSKDGSRIASGSIDNTVKLWDVPVSAARANYEAHKPAAGAVAVSPDGTLFATGGADKLVRLWTAADGKPARDLAGHAAAVAQLDFRKDNKQLA